MPTRIILIDHKHCQYEDAQRLRLALLSHIKRYEHHSHQHEIADEGITPYASSMDSIYSDDRTSVWVAEFTVPSSRRYVRIVVALKKDSKDNG